MEAQPKNPFVLEQGDWLADAVSSMRPDDAMDVFRHVCEAHRHDLIKDLMLTDKFLQGSGGPGPLVEWAMVNAQPKAAKAVIDTFADKQAALVEACGEGYVDLVEALLMFSRADPAADGQAALLAACKAGQVPVVRILCHLAAVDPAFNQYEPLRLAIFYDHFDLLRYMMEVSADEEIRFLPPGSRMPVYEAMRQRKVEALVLLMEGGHEESHSKLNEKMRQQNLLRVTALSPEAVRACIAGKLGVLQAGVPDPFHSMDEFDVLLGLARHYPELIAFLRHCQHAYLKAYPGFEQIMHAEGQLVFSLEDLQTYGFMIGKQFRYLKTFLDGIPLGPDNLHVLSREQRIELHDGLHARAFKRIDP
jgi:hypothetical protein